MNLKSTFLSILLSLLLLNVYSQEKVLVLTSRYSKGEKVITGGKRLKIVSTKDEIYQGKLAFVDQSCNSGCTKIIVGADTINLEEIKLLKKKSVTSTILGCLATTLGGGGILYGISLLSVAADTGDMSGVLSIFGAYLTAGGIVGTGMGIFILTGAEKFNASDWEYAVELK